MNEQANRQLVQQAYQSVKAGDVQSLLNSQTMRGRRVFARRRNGCRFEAFCYHQLEAQNA